jgi:hypothetical protein
MIPQITQAEIQELKKMLEAKIGNYSIVYNKNEEGQDDFAIYKGESGEDAFWSGSIILEQDYYINWEFSLKNGAKIVNATLKLNEQNKDIVASLYDMYQIWYENLNKYIRGEAGAEGGLEMPEEPAMGAGAGEEVVAGGEELPGSVEGEALPLSESRTLKGRKKTIDSSNDRMKRLAGL